LEKKKYFFELTYYLKLRHNLDVMHIEKNVCDNIIETLMNVEKKTKDNMNSWFDLVHMGIRVKLHATMIEEGKYTSPYACYTMSYQEKHAFCEFLVDLKVPDSSNISRCINV